MKKIIVLLFSLFSFSFGAGVYDGFDFTDYEEKGGLFFCNTATTSEITGAGLSSTHAAWLLSNRPFVDLFTVSNNINFFGDDMKRIRERADAITIPAQNNPLGLLDSDFNYLMALSGLLIGILFAFGLIVNISQIAKKN